MTQDNNVVKLIQPAEFSDPLTEVLREGARALLAQAVEAEVAAFLSGHADKHTEDSRQRLVRHGHRPERAIMTGLGPVPVRAPRVRDRTGAGESRIRFTSAILPPYARRSKSLEVLIPILYLKGISSGDFEDALAALLGPDAGGLSASSIARLKDAWSDEHVRWSKRDLSAKRYVYVWVDGIHVQARLEDDAQCLLVIIGATSEGKKELVGLTNGVRESVQSWRELLLDLRRRGLSIGPELAVCGPEVIDGCRVNGVDFIFGVAPTSTLRRHAERLEVRTLARFAVAPHAGKVRRYTEFYDGAASWSRVERIIARVEAGADGTDTRFIVTSLPTRNARVLYEELYCRRGAAENHIKSWKTHLAADRTSCTRASANQFRLFLHADAYWLLWSLRSLMPKRSQWRVAQFDTLRLAEAADTLWGAAGLDPSRRIRFGRADAILLAGPRGSRGCVSATGEESQRARPKRSTIGSRSRSRLHGHCTPRARDRGAQTSLLRHERSAPLTIHRRTLTRRLNAQGTAYRQVANAVRFEIARQLLAEPDMTIAQVAAMLKFSEPGAFTRAFRRWSGRQTPSAWRAQHCKLPAR